MINSKNKLAISDLFTQRVNGIEMAFGILIYLLRLLTFRIRSAKNRYSLITPKIFKTQIIYDNKQNKYLKIQIRDESDLNTMGQIFLTEDYDTTRLKRNDDILSLYGEILKKNKKPLIFDCGGNIGLATKYFAAGYDGAKIVCIEPNKSNIEQARKNNSAEIIDFIESAIGSENGHGTINDPGLGHNAYRISAAQNGVTPIISINDLLQKYKQVDYIPFIIKIDIEGYESDLFSKNIEWIELFPVLIIELHDWMFPRCANSNNFLKAMSMLDRDFIYIGENIFSLSNKILGK